MRDLIQTQKITLINLNDREDVQVRTIYYILGGLLEFERGRKATPREIRKAYDEAGAAESFSWINMLTVIANILITVFVSTLTLCMAIMILGSIHNTILEFIYNCQKLYS